MKKILFIICLVLLSVSLSSCKQSASFNGSRTGNSTQLIMEYSIFNTTDSQILKLDENDIMNVKIINNGGTLSVELQKKDAESPVYINDNVETSEFQIEIKESGEYRLKVTGNQTKGSLSFIKK